MRSESIILIIRKHHLIILINHHLINLINVEIHTIILINAKWAGAISTFEAYVLKGAQLTAGWKAEGRGERELLRVCEGFNFKAITPASAPLSSPPSSQDDWLVKWKEASHNYQTAAQMIDLLHQRKSEKCVWWNSILKIQQFRFSRCELSKYRQKTNGMWKMCESDRCTL